jgi:ketosteroid isomerase-like protein
MVQTMAGRVRDELIALSNEWDRAMVANDAAAIGRFMADDWVIIGSDGSVGDKATFLGLIRSGMLSHDVMESAEMEVRVYGSTGVVISRGISGGRYQGRPFREIERVSCVFVRESGRWQCVLTHLSRLVPPEAGTRLSG